MSRTVYLYDDPADLPNFLPFTQSRPIGELRYGAQLLRERWAAESGGQITAHLVAAHLVDFTEPDAPPVVTALPATGERLCFRSAFVPAYGLSLVFDSARGPRRFTDAGGHDVGCFLPGGTPWPGPAFPAAWPAQPIDGALLAGIWQVIADLLPALRADRQMELFRQEPSRVPGGCTVLGDPADLIVEDGVLVEPMVVFDTQGGPIWIQEGAEIRSFSRLAGPLVIGRGTRVVGGQLRESSIGPRCVVHGEISNSIFLGYANKSHDGFLGHSIVGRWANLGAGTITSNLKNTYGPIRLNLGDARVDTGMTFLGSLVGDHVKTAIGTMLPTGCVIGTGANLFGTKRPDSAVRSFAWGTDDPDRVLACRMFLQTAGRVLPRRQVTFDDTTRRYLESVWRHCTGQPCD